MVNQEQDLKNTFLTLVRLGLKKSSTSVPKVIDWQKIYDLAICQGLTAIVLDGAQVLSDMGLLIEGRSFDSKLKKQWIAQVVTGYERKYEDYRDTISKLTSFYNKHGIKMMLLKGYGLSLNYPLPNHRPCGDIDIWVFGHYREADSILSRELSIPIDTSHHHHTVFRYQGYVIENHYDWVNTFSDYSNAEMEKVFKRLAVDDSHSITINNQVVYLPSPDLHALFLLRHSMSHFASTSMSIRQLLDWGFFVEKHSQEINWEWLLSTLERFHMKDFMICLNAICVADLGFDMSIFPTMQIDVFLKDRVLNDMLTPEFSDKQPSTFYGRILFKYRRWRANSWKHKLCYKESMFITFITGVCAHIMKPSSI